MSNAVALSLTGKSRGELAPALHALIQTHELRLIQIRQFADFARGRNDITSYFLSGSRMSSYEAQALFEESGAVRALNAESWSEAMRMTDLLSLMTAKRRNEWSEMIHDMKCPDFDLDTVMETFQALFLKREDLLAEKVEGIFYRLSGNHVTNSPMAFRERMIIDGILDSFGFLRIETVEYLNDLRGIMQKIAGVDTRELPELSADLRQVVREQRFGEWLDFDGGAFRIRIYKKGTAHVEVHDDMALHLNSILAHKNPGVIAGSSRAKTKTKKEITLRYDLIPADVRHQLARFAEIIVRRRDGTEPVYSGGMTPLLPETTDILESLGCSMDDNHNWMVNEGTSAAISEIVRTGVAPEKVSHQFYQTPQELVELVHEYACIEDHHKVLEPSAGTGALLKGINPHQAVAVEVTPMRAAMLKEQGFDVRQVDFLDMEPNQSFDRVVMNPPYSNGQALRHVKHALGFLNQGGMLVAVVPASLKGQTFPGYRMQTSEVMAGKFKDAGVNVFVLALEKK